jgi:hypothetical protein
MMTSHYLHTNESDEKMERIPSHYDVDGLGEEEQDKIRIAITRR